MYGHALSMCYRTHWKEKVRRSTGDVYAHASEMSSATMMALYIGCRWPADVPIATINGFKNMKKIGGTPLNVRHALGMRRTCASGLLQACTGRANGFV